MQKLEYRTWKKSAIFVILSILLLIGIVVYDYSQYRGDVTVQSSQKVDVYIPQSESVFVTESYIGRVEAINDAKILPNISGYVVKIAASGGQTVQTGDPLIVIQQEEYLSALMESEANLFAAKADCLNAKVKYERMQKAGEKTFAPQEIDNAEAAYLVAESNVKKAEANRLAAQTNFDYTVLKAPFTGIIGNVSLSIGDFVSPQSAILMQIIQYSPIRVVFSISDKEYLKLADVLFNPEIVQIKVQLADGRILPDVGKIRYTSNTIDEKTNSMAVYAQFENQNRLLLPNAYVKVLLERKFDNVLLIPRDRIVLQNDNKGMYVVKNGEIILQSVTVLAEKDNYYVLQNDLPQDVFIPVQPILPDNRKQKIDINIVKQEK